MNRQLVVNGEKDANGNIVYGKIGHLLSYDKAGNRTSDTYRGRTALLSNGRYLASAPADQETVERYTYDALGRLDTTKRDDMYHRHAPLRRGRPGHRVRPGRPGAATTNIEATATALGLAAEKRTYSYDDAGRVTRQQTSQLGGDTINDVYFVVDKDNPQGGYDRAGNLIGYTVYVPRT